MGHVEAVLTDQDRQEDVSALGEARFVHFAPIGMMLATPVLDLAEVARRFAPPYVVEDKYDGIRAQVHKAGDRVELYSRTFDRITTRYPELVPPLLAIPGSYVIDGEVLAFAEGKAVPFTDFQTPPLAEPTNTVSLPFSFTASTAATRPLIVADPILRAGSPEMVAASNLTVC